MTRDDGFERCRLCGCSEMDACWDEAGPCSWIAPGLCTVCAEDPARFIRECVELVAWLDERLPAVRNIVDAMTISMSAQQLAKLTGYPSRTARRLLAHSSDWSVFAKVAAKHDELNPPPTKD